MEALILAVSLAAATAAADVSGNIVGAQESIQRDLALKAFWEWHYRNQPGVEVGGIRWATWNWAVPNSTLWGVPRGPGQPPLFPFPTFREFDPQSSKH